MDKKKLEQILNKYEEVIKEELNVKEINLENFDVKLVYKPVGVKIKNKYGKDTGKIISLAKKGNVRDLEDGKIEVFSDEGETWILESDEYEIQVDGLPKIEGYDFDYDESLIVGLNLQINEELKKEGVVREISRFINQMRKDAEYNVDDRIVTSFYGDSEVVEIVKSYEDFLKGEILAKSILYSDLENFDIEKEFESEFGKLKIKLFKD